MDIIIVFINILCGKKIYYIKYSRLFSHSINSRYVIQSIKNIFKHSGVAGEIQLGAGPPVSSPWWCGGTLTHSEVIKEHILKQKFKPRYANNALFFVRQLQKSSSAGDPLLDSRFLILSCNLKLS